jgi:hypothetical protein
MARNRRERASAIQKKNPNGSAVRVPRDSEKRGGVD